MKYSERLWKLRNYKLGAMLKNCLKHIFAVFLFAMFFSSCEVKELSDIDQPIFEASESNGLKDFSNENYGLINLGNCGQETEVPLFSDAGIEVGYIRISVSNQHLMVVFNTYEQWLLDHTYLNIASAPGSVPANLENYTYSASHQPNVKSFVYDAIDVSNLPELSISAKAHVTEVSYITDLEAIRNALPTEPINYWVFKNAKTCYFDGIVSAAGFLDGTYNGYGIDVHMGFRQGFNYRSVIIPYTSDSDLLKRLVHKPQNLDVITYIINQDYAYLGATWTEVAGAIIHLAENYSNPTSWGGFTWNKTIADQITADALLHGENYIPPYNGYIGLIPYTLNDVEVPNIPISMLRVPLSVIPNSFYPVFGDQYMSQASNKIEFRYCVCDISDYIADLSKVENALPEEFVNINLQFNKPISLWQINLTNAGMWNGSYSGFCVDIDHFISPNVNYNKMKMISSYTGDNEIITRLVDKPENLDLVNYLLNQDYSSIGATGNELQAVIWTLIDDKLPKSSSSLSWDQTIVDQILTSVWTNGENFVPDCDDKIMVIFDPGNEKEQVVFMGFPVDLIQDVCIPEYACQ